MTEPAARKISSEFVFVRRVVVVAAIAAVAAALWFLSDVILLLFGSVLFAMTLRTLARPLTRLGLGETAALAVAGLLGLAVVAAAIVFFGAEVAEQSRGLFTRLSMFFREVAQEFEANALGDVMKNVNPASSLANLIPRFLSWGFTIGGALLGLGLVVMGGLYIAADPRSYRDGFIKLIPPSYHANIRATLGDADKALGLWLGGQLTAMVLVGALTGAGLWLAGVQSALALGLLAGLFNFVPYIGSITAALVTLVVASGQGWETVLWAAGVMFAVQQIESNVITPLVVGRAVSLRPAAGLYAIVAMGVLLGPLGLLFGFPLAIVTDIAIRRLYVRDTLDEPVEILGKPARKSGRGEST